MPGTELNKHISLWIDPEGDFLEVIWQVKDGVFVETAADRVMKKVDDQGNVLGFHILGVSTFEGNPFEIPLGAVAEPLRLTVDEAARELGVSAARIRQLLLEGRVEGADRIGHEWLIRSPVSVRPGSRGPIGIAGPRHRDSGSERR